MLSPLSVFYTPVWAGGFFPLFFLFFFTPVEMRNLFYVEKTSRMALDVDQM